MKLLRWTLAGASFYVVYKYAIGKKARGEEVFESPETATGEEKPPAPRAAQPSKPRKRKPKASSGE